MSYSINPLIIKYKTGPSCGGCPFRRWSFGFAPAIGDPISSKYLFVAEHIARQECVDGRPLAGGTGRVHNELLALPGIVRSRCVITNVVLCRPIRWTPHKTCKGQGCKICQDGLVPHRQGNHDFVNESPSPAQVRECTSRYFEQTLKDFQGDTIVGLGKIALQYFAGGARRISQYRGTKFEHGEMITCGRCEGKRTIPGGMKNCPTCKGKLVVKDQNAVRDIIEHNSLCHAHPKFVGKAKPRSSCLGCWAVYHVVNPWCPNCSGQGKSPREPKTCPICHGAGALPADPDQEFVSEKLKPGQIFFPVYHPAIIFQDAAKYWEILSEDFLRIPHLREEMAIEALKDYDETPKLDKVDSWLHHEGPLSLDFETTGLDPETDDILLLGVSPKPLSSISINEGHSRFLSFLRRKNIIGQNWMQFDGWWAWVKHRILPPPTVWDTRMAGHLLNPDTPNDLTYLTGKYARPPAQGYWKTSQNYRENKPLVAMIDTDMTYRVRDGQKAALESHGMLNHFLTEVMPTAHVAFDMRRGGVKVNADLIRETHEKLSLSLVESRGELPDWGGTRTEGQHAKVHHHLYTAYELPVQVSKETGRPTADERSLLELRRQIEASHHDTDHLTDERASEVLRFVDLILSLRGKAKTLGYFKPDSVPADNIFHPVWNSVGTATMRFSASGFNPMVFPKCQCEPKCYGENPDCKSIRAIILPDQLGYELMSVDISQAEVVGFLYAAEEWGVLDQVLHHGLDAHQLMADKLQISRAEGKQNTFAYIYGEHEKTQAARTRTPLARIQAIRTSYARKFPGIPVFRSRYIRQAMREGYVESPFGIRRYIRVTREVGRAANQAANAPIQNIPPMVVRRGMIKLHHELPPYVRIIINAHDELVLSYPEAMRALVAEAVRDVFTAPIPEMPAKEIGMASGLKFNIDISVGPNWAEMRKT